MEALQVNFENASEDIYFLNIQIEWQYIFKCQYPINHYNILTVRKGYRNKILFTR